MLHRNDDATVASELWIADSPSLGSTPLTLETDGDVIQWVGGDHLVYNDKLISWSDGNHRVVLAQ